MTLVRQHYTKFATGTFVILLESQLIKHHHSYAEWVFTKHKWLHKSNTYKTRSIYITKQTLMKHTIFGLLIDINH